MSLKSAPVALQRMGGRLERIDVHRLGVPLIKPYRLAFGDLIAFDTLLVEVTDDSSRTGFGEATVLTGYTDETIDGSWALAQQLCDELPGTRPDEAWALLEGAALKAPVLATAFLTALEMLASSRSLQLDEPTPVPILGLLSGGDEGRINHEVETLLAQGYRTFKFKVGLPGVDDLQQVRLVQRAVAGRARVRIDANQAYSGEQAARFLAALDPEGIELFEQPCAADDWQAYETAAKAARVPMMLDESIYQMADIERAAEQGLSAFIKVKLMKFSSLDRVTAAIQRIRDLGMQPVLGNGVACDVGCWMEACIAARHIDNAGEMNGYLKVREPLLANPPPFADGHILLEPDYSPVLNRDVLRRYGRAFHSARSHMH